MPAWDKASLWGKDTLWGKLTLWGSQAHAELAGAYADVMLLLLPRGKLWTDDRARKLALLYRGMSEEWARVDERASDVIDESDLRTADELIGEWETFFGLPDPCETSPPTLLQERRDALVAKAKATGGQSIAYFTAVALDLGVVVTITEHQHGLPFRMGVGRMGDPLNGEGAAFQWQVDAPAATPAALRARLECLFDRLEPAHAVLTHTYT